MEKVIIFDGECNLCLSVVRFIRKHNRRGDFLFVPQNSDEGKSMISKLSVPPEDTTTVIYVTSEGYVVRSTAVLHILKEMGGLWKFFYVFKIVPVFIRDAFYRLVAKYRQAVFRALIRRRQG